MFQHFILVSSWVAVPFIVLRSCSSFLVWGQQFLSGASWGYIHEAAGLFIVFNEVQLLAVSSWGCSFSPSSSNFSSHQQQFLSAAVPISSSSYQQQFLSAAVPICSSSYQQQFLSAAVPISSSSCLQQFLSAAVPVSSSSYLQQFLSAAVPVCSSSYQQQFLSAVVPFRSSSYQQQLLYAAVPIAAVPIRSSSFRCHSETADDSTLPMSMRKQFCSASSSNRMFHSVFS